MEHMADCLSDGDRDEYGSVSPLRSGSADWELISPGPGSPPLSRDAFSAALEAPLQGISLFDSGLAPSRLLLDDYFAYAAGSCDPLPTPAMGEIVAENANAAQGVETGSFLESQVADISQHRIPPLTLSPESDSIAPSFPPHVVAEQGKDVDGLTLESPSGAEPVRIGMGVLPSRGFCQGDLALELCSASEPSTVRVNHHLPSNSHMNWNDMQESVSSVQHSSQLSEPGDDAEQSAVAHDAEPFLGEGYALDAVEPNRRLASGSNKLRKALVCKSWLRRHLALWQAQLGQANTVWSFAVAAAVMGLLILRRGWQRLQAQNRNLRMQLHSKDKKITQLMFQLMQVKDTLSKTRRIPVIRAKPSLQIPQDQF